MTKKRRDKVVAKRTKVEESGHEPLSNEDSDHATHSIESNSKKAKVETNSYPLDLASLTTSDSPAAHEILQVLMSCKKALETLKEGYIQMTKEDREHCLSSLRMIQTDIAKTSELCKSVEVVLLSGKADIFGHLNHITIPEIWANIFSFLSFVDFLKVARVCKLWKQASELPFALSSMDLSPNKMNFKYLSRLEVISKYFKEKFNTLSVDCDLVHFPYLHRIKVSSYDEQNDSQTARTIPDTFYPELFEKITSIEAPLLNDSQSEELLKFNNISNLRLMKFCLPEKIAKAIGGKLKTFSCDIFPSNLVPYFTNLEELILGDFKGEHVNLIKLLPKLRSLAIDSRSLSSLNFESETIHTLFIQRFTNINISCSSLRSLTIEQNTYAVDKLVISSTNLERVNLERVVTGLIIKCDETSFEQVFSNENSIERFVVRKWTQSSTKSFANTMIANMRHLKHVSIEKCSNNSTMNNLNAIFKEVQSLESLTVKQSSCPSNILDDICSEKYYQHLDSLFLIELSSFGAQVSKKFLKALDSKLSIKTLEISFKKVTTTAGHIYIPKYVENFISNFITRIINKTKHSCLRKLQIAEPKDNFDPKYFQSLELFPNLKYLSLSLESFASTTSLSQHLPAGLEFLEVEVRVSNYEEHEKTLQTMNPNIVCALKDR